MFSSIINASWQMATDAAPSSEYMLALTPLSTVVQGQKIWSCSIVRNDPPPLQSMKDA